MQCHVSENRDHLSPITPVITTLGVPRDTVQHIYRILSSYYPYDGPSVRTFGPTFPVHMTKSRRSGTTSIPPMGPLWAAECSTAQPAVKRDLSHTSHGLGSLVTQQEQDEALDLRPPPGPFLWLDNTMRIIATAERLAIRFPKPWGHTARAGKASQPCPPIH